MIFYKCEGLAPAWMKAPARQDCTGFYIYGEGEPFAFPLPSVEWERLTTEVEYVIVGEFEPTLRESVNNTVFTPCNSSCLSFPVYDRTGKVWTVPVIISDDGVRLSLPWSKDGDAIVRKPSKEQSEIIATCQSLRESFLSDGGGEDLPMELAAHAAGLILSYSYHNHKDEFLLNGILDDHLVPRVLLAACGLGTAENGITDT